MRPGLRASKISLIYLVAAAAWIALSDRVLSLLVPPDALSSYQTYKGWLFVLVTALLLYTLIRSALRSIQRSEERFRNAVLHSPYPIMLHEADGDVAMLNRTWSELTGYSAEEIPSIAAWAQEALGSADRGEEWFRCASQPGGCEFTVRTKSGKTRTWKCSSAPLRAEADDDLHITVAVDITDQKSLEAQLSQSQKMEAMGRLAGGVAHDFNNLLTIIAGHTAALEDLGTDHPAYESVAEIEKAVERGAALTRQLLVFSKRQVLQPAVIDLNTVVSGTETMLRRIIGENIRLGVSYFPHPCPVKADPGQIGQVLLNLAVNARDAMPDGGELSISTQVSTADGNSASVWLRVSDTGQGMDPDVLAHIYEPFFTTKPSGTGLGLATVYGIVRQSGGEIDVRSAPGAGTVFTIILPKSDQAPEPAAEIPTEAPSRRGGGVVLLAEDDDAVRTMISLALASSGYSVLEAADASAALLRSKEHAGPIDLLITDLLMPGQNGRQLADRLLAARPAMRVLYISGYADSALLDARVEASLLRKPFTPDQLSKRVREVLDS